MKNLGGHKLQFLCWFCTQEILSNSELTRYVCFEGNWSISNVWSGINRINIFFIIVFCYELNMNIFTQKEATIFCIDSTLSLLVLASKYLFILSNQLQKHLAYSVFWNQSNNLQHSSTVQSAETSCYVRIFLFLENKKKLFRARSRLWWWWVTRCTKDGNKFRCTHQ